MKILPNYAVTVHLIEQRCRQSGRQEMRKSNGHIRVCLILIFLEKYLASFVKFHDVNQSLCVFCVCVLFSFPFLVSGLIQAQDWTSPTLHALITGLGRKVERPSQLSCTLNVQFALATKETTCFKPGKRWSSLCRRVGCEIFSSISSRTLCFKTIILRNRNSNLDQQITDANRLKKKKIDSGRT